MALGGNHIACCFNDYWKCSSHCVAVCNICLFMLLDIYNMIIVEYIRYYLSILMETMHNNIYIYIYICIYIYVCTCFNIIHM